MSTLRISRYVVIKLFKLFKLFISITSLVGKTDSGMPKQRKFKELKKIDVGTPVHCHTELYQEDNFKSVSIYKDFFVTLNKILHISPQMYI